MEKNNLIPGLRVDGLRRNRQPRRGLSWHRREVVVVDQLELVDHLAPCHPAGGGAAAVGHLAAGADQAGLVVVEQLGRLQPPELALVEFEQVSWELPATISIIRLCSQN